MLLLRHTFLRILPTAVLAMAILNCRVDLSCGALTSAARAAEHRGQEKMVTLGTKNEKPKD